MDAYRLGIEKFRQGDLCDAKRYFEAALIDAPDDPKIHCDLGVTQMTLGALDSAIERLMQAHTLAPTAPVILVNLANNNRGQTTVF